MVISTKTFRPAFLFITLVILGANFAQAQRVGINTSTPSSTLDIRGLNPDDGGVLQIGNSDETLRLLFFGGREGDPNPFMQWKEGRPMRFVTDEGGFRELMRIEGNGNVGIGSVLPEERLQIGGFQNNQNTYFKIGTIGGNDFKVGIKLRHFSNKFGWTLESEEFLGRFNIIRHLDSEVGNVALSISGFNGNVGVGIPEPTEKLHVAGNIRVQNNSSIFGLDQVVGFNDLKLAGDASGGTDMTIGANGRVGINTAQSTNSLFYIKSKPDDLYTMYLEDNNAAFRFGVTRTGQVGINAVSGGVTLSVRGISGNAEYFRVENPEGNPLLRVLSNGNVGIGTISPTEKLHVAGNIRVQNNGSIFGLDQLVGFNDLKLSGDSSGGTDMTIGANGRIGINTVASTNSLFYIKSKPDDLYTMFMEDNNANFRFGVERTGHAGVNASFNNVTFNVRGIGGDVDYFSVENPTGGLLLRVRGNGNVAVTNTLSKGGGSFKIDHPLDPENKYLYHSFVESPDMMNVYNGNIVTNVNGEAVVTMPDWFEALNKDFRYQLTTIGQPAQAWVQDELKGNRFTLKTDKPNIKVSWQITGIRKDAWAEKNRIPVEEKKNTEERGKYQHPESFGKPATLGVGFKESMDGNILRNE